MKEDQQIATELAELGLDGLVRKSYAEVYVHAGFADLDVGNLRPGKIMHVDKGDTVNIEMNGTLAAADLLPLLRACRGALGAEKFAALVDGLEALRYKA